MSIHRSISQGLAQELLAALENLAVNVDEDCPGEYRTEHLRTALEDAFALIARAKGGAS
jgi:hypothetical protein